MGDFEFVILEGPNKNQSLVFPAEWFFIGSAPECQVRVSVAGVKPKHAEVRFDTRGEPWIRDLSGGQLKLNGEPAQEGLLAEGTFVHVGPLELVVRLRGRTSPSGTMATPTPMRSAGRPVSRPNIELPLDATTRRPTPFRASAAAPPNDETLRRTPAPGSSALPPGTIIDGRYHVVRKLAAGGMGEVYKAEHVELGKSFAIKVMLPELSRDEEFVARFKREAIAASRIGQQNIVDISDFGQTSDGRFYFVMEYLDGLTLASLIHRQGAIDPLRTTNIGVQVARALAAAHAQGIVHRDLKPENVMLLQRPGQPDFVKVLDFGVAKVATGQGQGGHTAVGMVVGTPQYMSPEQAKAIAVDARSDIYSLGLIVYELATGRPTFSGETPSILMVKHVTEAPPPFHPGPVENLPVELEDLVLQMLAKEPDDRPQKMEDVVARLDSINVRIKANDPSLARAEPTELAEPPEGTPGVAVRVSGGQRSVVSSGSNARVSGRRAGLATGASAAPPRTPKPRSNPRQVTVVSEEAPEEELVVKSSKAPMVIGAVVVLALIAGGAVFALRPSTGPTTPTTVEEPAKVVEVAPEPAKTVVPVKPADPPTPDPRASADEKVKLKVSTEPSGAEVYEGEVLLGKTPITLERPQSAVAELHFKLAGYVPLTKKLGFATDHIELTLEKVRVAVPRPNAPGLKDLPSDPDIKDSPY